MPLGSFKGCAMVEGNSKFNYAVKRFADLYSNPGEIRTEFGRDYTRILHSTAYRRLKHKTQVFFATTNDHICTRIEHVNHVTSVSRTISNFLGLNTELVEAIAIGHDIGHAPFGHKGEQVLNNLCNKFLSPKQTFWHERNSLRLADYIETLEGLNGQHVNLNLTYAVRDGLVCHCGEVDDLQLHPREDALDLEKIDKAATTSPYTWEGCIVKISDKIAYLGRDIEDAKTLSILSSKQLHTLNSILKSHSCGKAKEPTNTTLIKTFIRDLCDNSTPDSGICFSQETFDLMKDIKGFCYDNIYKHDVLERYKAFVEHLMTGLFSVLQIIAKNFISEKDHKVHTHCPTLEKEFSYFLQIYSQQHTMKKFEKVKKIYKLSDERDRNLACIDFLSGMTDHYAIRSFKETISY